MTDWISLASFLVICFVAAGLGGIATGRSVEDWYEKLRKPSWTPSGGFIGTVWFILYTLMAIAAWLVWISRPFEQMIVQMFLFFFQLGLNVAWSFLFFGLKKLKAAFVEVLIFWASILLTLISFLFADVLAGLLFISYLAWVSVASLLNYEILRLNPA